MGLKLSDYYYLEYGSTLLLSLKTYTWHVRSAKTQNSLGISPVWSESSLSAWRKLGSLATHWAHSEDCDQTGRVPRLIWVFAGRTFQYVGFVTRRLIWRNHVLHVLASIYSCFKSYCFNVVSCFRESLKLGSTMVIWCLENSKKPKCIGWSKAKV